MISSLEIKQIVKELGADLCGIASIQRFDNAPRGFHPTDIYEKCKSVVVFAKKAPKEILYASSCVPYTNTINVIMQELDILAVRCVLKLEELGIGCIPLPSDDPYEHWEPERMYGRAILSMRHAGYLAGLGVLGKNTLLINEKYGNMIHLGAVLVDIELEGDPIASYEACITSCKLCIDNCPQKALDGTTVNQFLCRPLSTFKTEKGYTLHKCFTCRKICPSALGMK